MRAVNNFTSTRIKNTIRYIDTYKEDIFQGLETTKGNFEVFDGDKLS